METTVKASSLRWKILRQALLRKPTGEDSQSEIGVKKITRKTTQGFNLIPSHIANDPSSRSGDVTVCYTLPDDSAPKLHLTQRVVDRAELSDFEICNEYNIDNTGLVCQWPSEEVLAYFCLTHTDMFRSKRVLELGSGYGLGGFVIAAVTEASEVVISDGNPQVVNYIQHNIDANSKAFGGTKVKSMMLHWNQNEISTISSEFDLIVASDCTFFKEFHNGLAQILKFLLGKVKSSEAIFFSPKRGDSLDKFLEAIKECGLHFSITENYDAEIWKHHEEFLDGDGSWPSYQKDHCYPLLIRITV
ncbi:calmodulin-lysine N-methyltransferase [Pyrus x bretschneideri]|uniref:calmodulin-lysine N-methyltransferase n=1 Tax=Pyrus x bretschneideri TaxID=225117 RepID=UPI00202F0123|nr:calmodulin-lysine N-methyltransferase [Pyrus x bretschneideri]